MTFNVQVRLRDLTTPNHVLFLPHSIGHLFPWQVSLLYHSRRKQASQKELSLLSSGNRLIKREFLLALLKNNLIKSPHDNENS